MNEVTLEPRGADEKIFSKGASNVREVESVDIEIDSRAEVSCLLLNIGADRRSQYCLGKICVELVP